MHGRGGMEMRDFLNIRPLGGVMIHMKAITWLASMSMGIAIIAPAATATAPEGWMTDLEKGLAQAKAEEKAVLISFVGSDWCPPCIAMEREVYSKPEFVEKASEKFVLVKIDIPRGDQDLAEKNRPYALKYRIEGFPMIVLLDSEGEEFSRVVSTSYPTVEDLLKQLNRALDRKDFD